MFLFTTAAQAGTAWGAWDIGGQVGIGAMEANDVLPAPLALGASLVAERGILGLEMGGQINPATYCDSPSGEGHCGFLLIAEAGPRLRLPLSQRWIPYLSMKMQWLRMTKAASGYPGLAPRLGLLYQRERLGVFVEAGITMVMGNGPDIDRLIGIYDHRWLPAASLGLRF